MNKWTSIEFYAPPEGERVRTKVSDLNGDRNDQILIKKGNLWFSDDGMYVYYTPTHWKYIDSPVKWC